ncbi:hypothetical protein IJ425_08645 [bacterium]|nr:hypothetical protein [bacterium]
MLVNPISFMAKHRVVVGKKGVTENEIKNEYSMAQNARNIGVGVPEYSVAYLKYNTEGKKANPNTNPITKEHLDSVFKNIYLMDKNGINHNDLDIQHVYYGNEGKVEIDCFRFADRFKRNNPALPDFFAPTNQINYETASIAPYVEKFYSQDSRNLFVSDYLEASSKFHKKRSEYMAQDILEKGENSEFSTKMLNYEILKADVTENPDNQMVFLMLQKLDFLGKQRRAFTKWDESNGACGHEFSLEGRIDSIPMYLDAVESAINYSQMAKELSKENQGRRALYFDYESQLGEFYANTYLSWIKGMANWNFEDDRMLSDVDEQTRNMLNDDFQAIIDADLADKKEAMSNYLKLYKEYSY